jgi:prepilin-type processing-associated H-X9-DG protein
MLPKHSSRCGLYQPVAGSARGGITLVEVLTALGVISLLAAILLPAVQSVRERARLLQCADNLRQVGVAVHAHESVHGSLPYTSALRHDPAMPHAARPGRSVHASLLPWLDQQNIADELDPTVQYIDLPKDPIDVALVLPPGAAIGELLRDTKWFAIAQHHVPVFRCPADSSRTGGGNNYRACMGSVPHILYPDAMLESYDESILGAWVFDRALKTSAFDDGMSSTALFSERVIGDLDRDHYDPLRDYAFQNPPMAPEEADQFCSAVTADWIAHDSWLGTTWLFGGLRHTWYTHTFPPNSGVPDCGGCGICAGGGTGACTARSFHRSCANVLFADGHVKPVADTIDATVWRALGTRAGSRRDPPEPTISDL